MPRKPPRNAGNRLLAYIERVEREEKEIELLKAGVRDIYAEAKGAGFDPKVMRALVSERKRDPTALAEFEALRDIYRATLGMLGGTPLGDAARKRLVGGEEPKQDSLPGTLPEDGDEGREPTAGMDDEPEPPAAPTISDADIAEAKAQGGQAARDGIRITANPFAAGDPRRAAWDEGWCGASGSDGMDIPAAFRRSKPAKPKKGEGEDGSEPKGGDGAGGEE